ncbi:MAG: hypothetical protein NW220_14670 [Leptolyngbyaceae cyanobacterium bins.349]|nr:hypothetical protein [Leptolyngbyaceae cyanobacterium bins.349]
MVLQLPRSTKPPVVTWQPLPDDFILPDEPVENIEQPFLAAALTDALGQAELITPEMLIAANFGIVANVNQKTVVKAPDWVWVSQVFPISEGVIRRSYTPNLEGAPIGIVMEFLSESDSGELSVRSTYPYGKLYFYEQIVRVPTYAVFDPVALSLEVRRLQANGFYEVQNPDEQERFWIPELNLFLGIWYGLRLGRRIHWLRWWDAAGNLLLWSAEKAEQERQRAEQAQQQAEQAQQQAEQERQRAEQERQRAEQAQQQAEQERQRSQNLAAKLRELGIDPTQI